MQDRVTASIFDKYAQELEEAESDGRLYSGSGPKKRVMIFTNMDMIAQAAVF